MVKKELSTRVSIVGRGAKCMGGKSAVELSSYISRTTIQSEYYGETYYPKYAEDLVHTEIMLPANAPPEYKDGAILWNAIEKCESKQPKAQLARSYKVTLPNEWSYEVATEVMQDYVQRNFVDVGMCAEWALHDSENPQHQRNLHCHILLTMRPILEDGTWGDKQKKIYFLDKDGNKQRTRNGNYKCSTQDVTGWNSRENASKWRKDLADTINATNEKMGMTDTFWEHRSFADRGLDKLPTVHLGEKASAMERAGIRTDRGDINRRVFSHNFLLEQAKAIYEEAFAKVEQIKALQPIVSIRNEILELIAKVVGIKGRLDLPIVSGKFIGKISNRSGLQDEEKVTDFIEKNGINTFDELNTFSEEKETDYQKIATEREVDIKELGNLEELQTLFEEYEPFKDIKKNSMALKGFAKIRYDKEHHAELEQYQITKDALYSKLKDGEKVNPKTWQTKIDTLYEKLESSKSKYAKLVSALAYAEVITYNRRNLEREQKNERQQPTQIKKKEQEI